uniref:Uncharacterized protein n=1 Tax=Graphocephala atropunctata TaxID=36148 RepID=A0A1B6MP91_9HEMI
MDIPDKSEMGEPSLQNAEDSEKLTCHLVRLPRLVLRRIDEKLHVTKRASPLKKAPLKRLGTQNITKRVNFKKIFSKPTGKEGNHQKSPGRPRKKPQLAVKLDPLHKKTTFKNLTPALKKPIKTAPKDDSGTKNLLKKTMLQKRSKVAIPPAKRPKLTSTGVKSTPKVRPVQTKSKNIITPNKKVNTPTLKPKKEHVYNITFDAPQSSSKPLDWDTSEDEFLYDELIEELENSPLKHPEYFPSSSEKTTNITLKPNVGNKPPTVVKGGIVKKTNLPVDLQPIASPNTKHSKEVHDPVKSVLDTKTDSVLGKNKLQIPSGSPVTTKKPSPWPISAPSSSKKDSKPTPKSVAKTKSSNVSNITKSSKIQQTKSKALPSPTSPALKVSNDVVLKPNSTMVVKPKFGPKQTAKVTPLSTALMQDDMSDEYTEEETLDEESLDDLLKSGNESIVTDSNTQDVDTDLKNVSNFNPSTDGTDPNLDLLRILTDDTDVSKADESQEKDVQICKISNGETPRTNLGKSSSENSTPSHTNEIEEEPPARTIYDLMNEISLQYPSWNLHIIPETNAFCIAQVTKGRLGLPTLKKCIELDPIGYNAKVYIHQYHIKRFDGVYDSEESIIALIQEINSIKA